MSEKRDFRKAYLNDFKKNPDGTYTYQGNYRIYQGQADRLPLLKLRLCALCAGMTAALLIPGFLSVPGLSGVFYVLIPYVAALALSVSAAWALGRFCAARQPLREYIYLETLPKVPGRAAAAATAAALTIVGETFFLCQSGFHGCPAQATAFLALLAVAVICGLLLHKYAKLLSNEFESQNSNLR